VERGGPAVCSVCDRREGKDEMTKTSVNLQDLRRRIYVKAKADRSWRFWGLYVHVCKMETLREAYALAKKNDGAPGTDGVTFEAIEAQGVGAFLEQIHDELTGRSYVPLPARRQEIPKDGGSKVRVLSIPAIRDRVVQGALKLILEPIFEADFQPGSFGYRPNRTAHEAVNRVAQAIVQYKTRVIDIDLRSYLDDDSYYTSCVEVCSNRLVAGCITLRRKPFLRPRLTWRAFISPRLTRCHTVCLETRNSRIV
jgi:RNA-directed DNA polymerase